MGPMDSVQFTSVYPQQAQQTRQAYSGLPEELCSAIAFAQQDPRAFEQQVARKNPQGYQELLSIRNSANPKQMARQLCQQRGVPPHIMHMFGL